MPREPVGELEVILGTEDLFPLLCGLVVCLAGILREVLNERGQQNAAHLLLQNDLVLRVIVASRYECRKEDLDQARVAEILEGQLA